MINFTRLSPFFRFFTHAHGESLGTRLVATMHLLTAFYGISIYRSQITPVEEMLESATVKYVKLENALTNCIDAQGNFTATEMEVMSQASLQLFQMLYNCAPCWVPWLYALNVHGVQLSPPPAWLSHVYPRDRAHIKTYQALLLLT